MIPAILCLIAVSIGIALHDWLLMIAGVVAIWGLVWVEAKA